MPPRDLRAYLFDVDEACRLVLEFTNGKSGADYAGDPLLRSAVERQLEIAGEALGQAMRVHAATLSVRIPEAQRIVAFRNQLAHGYASVLDDVVWAIVEREVPSLRATVGKLLDSSDD